MTQDIRQDYSKLKLIRISHTIYVENQYRFILDKNASNCSIIRAGCTGLPSSHPPFSTLVQYLIFYTTLTRRRKNRVMPPPFRRAVQFSENTEKRCTYISFYSCERKAINIFNTYCMYYVHIFKAFS